MKNKKGFTLIELIVCFALVTVLTISLFKTVLSIQQKQAKNISYNSFLSFVSVLNNTIQNDFTKDIITSVESCGTNCYDITYKDKGLTRLQVDRTNNTITYGSNVEELPKNYKFVKDISFNTYSSVTTGNYDSYYLLRLPIKGDFFPNLEDLKYMYQYNSGTIETKKHILNLDLDGGNLPGNYNNLLYSTGTVVNLPTPIKKNYKFKNWIKVNDSNATLSGSILTIGTDNVSLKANWIIEIIEYDYKGNAQEFVAEATGTYKIELWGAKGGSNSTVGAGAYTRGNINLNKNEKIYIYIGGEGNYTATGITEEILGGYNGGGSTGGQACCSRNFGSGGGATDIRYFDDYNPTSNDLEWDSEIGLRSRIMVAAGGGGSFGTSGNLSGAGYGGALVGGNATTANGYGPGGGGTQTAGGAGGKCTASTCVGIAGGFGYGESNSNRATTGGGGGYYSGGGSGHIDAAGGGSSFISGYTGCVAITSEGDPKPGCDNGTTDNSCSIHYSGKVFTDFVMTAGNASMPTHDGISTMIGNSGNGYAKITYLGE